MIELAPEVRLALEGFGLPADGASATRAASGLIHVTWIVELADGRRLVVQRMHPIFGVEVLDDIEAVTSRLAAAGLPTPRLRRTPGGAFHVPDAAGRPWRVLDHVEGRTFARVEGPEVAAEAARLVGRFHEALAELDHAFRFVRAGVHDTAAHLARLEARLGDAAVTPEGDRLGALGEEILREASALPPLARERLPRRVTHGDLKIDNVLFRPGDPPRAHALIDLDTLGRQPLAFELGDAWRSWCNPRGEDVEETGLDLALFRSAVEGYGSARRGTLRPEEVESLVPGLQTIAVELAARFCVDAFEDRYFGWDPARFPSRREHNRVRAAGQLALARAVAARRAEAEAVVTAALRG